MFESRFGWNSSLQNVLTIMAVGLLVSIQATAALTTGPNTFGARQINPFGLTGISLNTKPEFVDLNDEGDLDLVIGVLSGGFYYFENAGAVSSPAFVSQIGATNPLHGQNVGQSNAPTFGDLVGDGAQILVAGEHYGALFYYENTGSPQQTSFVLLSGLSNPLNGLDVGDPEYSPAVGDRDGNGDLDLLAGELNPVSVYFKNTLSPSVLALGATLGVPGETVTIPLTLTNPSATALGGMQLKVVLSDTSRAHFIVFSDSLAGLDFDTATSTLGDTTRIVLYSVTNDSIPQGTRTLGTLRYQLSPSAPLGSQNPLTLIIQRIGDPRGHALQATAVSGALLVGIRGDVNLDGRVDVLDLIRLARIVIGREVKPTAGSTAFAIADVNHDSALTVQDIAALGRLQRLTHWFGF